MSCKDHAQIVGNDSADVGDFMPSGAQALCCLVDAKTLANCMAGLVSQADSLVGIGR